MEDETTVPQDDAGRAPADLRVVKFESKRTRDRAEEMKEYPNPEDSETDDPYDELKYRVINMLGSALANGYKRLKIDPKLVSDELNTERALILQWYLQPSRKRKPKTILEFAAKLGRTPLYVDTVRSMLAPELKVMEDEMLDHARGALRRDTPEILHAQGEKARAGDLESAKYTMHVAHGIAPSGPGVVANVQVNVSLEELVGDDGSNQREPSWLNDKE